MLEKGYEENPENINEYLSGNVEQELGAQFNVVIEKQDALPVQFSSEIVNKKAANGLQFYFYGGDEMADFNGAKPVMTVRDDEFKIKIVDGQSGDVASLSLSVVQHDTAISAGVNDLGVPAMAHRASDGKLIVLPVPLPITDNGGSLTVDATDLDIRNLTNADVVTIEDGGGSITVDGTVAISGDVNVTATNLDIRDLSSATDSVSITDGGGSITVDGTVAISGDVNVTATNLDIRDLAFATDKVDVSGSSVTATIAAAAGFTPVCDFQTNAALGVGTEQLFFYVVPSGKTFTGDSILVGCRGAAKVRFGLSPLGVALTSIKGVYYQDPKENVDHSIERLTMVGDGTAAICVGVTNLDQATNEVYLSLQGSYVN